MKVLAAIALVALLGQLASTKLSSSQDWLQYKRQHGKSYATVEEEARRFANFLATKSMIGRHNADASQTYKMGLNHMADWTAEERARSNGFKLDADAQLGKREMPAEHRAYLSALLNSDEPVPDELDWRKTPGVVTDVKDQGKCGACWAFVTTGLLEGQQLKRNLTSKLISLSEMELVECSTKNFGCGGGSPDRALVDIAAIGGIESEADYPFRKDAVHCYFNKSKVVMTVSEPIVMSDITEEDLKKLLVAYGPVGIAIYASERLVAYKSGVFRDHCFPRMSNHGVLLVGYGTDKQAGDYWIMKNSWNKSWGEQGYFRIVRGLEMCGITTYPTIAKF